MTETLGLSPVQLLDTSLLGIDFFIDDDFEINKSQGGNYSVTTTFASELGTEEAVFCNCLFDVNYSMLSQDDSERDLLRMSCKFEARAGMLRSQIPEGKSDQELEEMLQTKVFSLGYRSLCSFVDIIARHSKLGKLYLPSIDVDEYMRFVFASQKEQALG